MRTSHTFTVLSMPPAARHVPLGWKSTEVTKLERQEPPREQDVCAGSEQTPEHRAPSHPRPSAHAVPQPRTTSLPPGSFGRWPRERKGRVRAAAAVTQVALPGEKAQHQF